MNKYVNKLKKYACIEAINYIYPGITVGIGTGSTIKLFIEELKKVKHLIKGAVSSSKESTKQLIKNKIKVMDLNEISGLQLYIDSADEINKNKQMIKGGGGALTGEKIISSFSDSFICIADENKIVKDLGKFFPVPVEVIPMSINYVCSQIKKLSGIPKIRKSFITDYGNLIIDVFNLNLENPLYIENKINSISGVVSVGLFIKRKADILLVGTKQGVKTYF
ncbi:ribose-5-phosphate isomerase RpiA [Buchnera aphidicola (Kurisakia onigurumii)]|uniref:ribose-5-phosphate isomerase RpiA n=1 Tax=Buchnera aphidicola TaxID=9 RepID=UPI0031B67E32